VIIAIMTKLSTLQVHPPSKPLALARKGKGREEKRREEKNKRREEKKRGKERESIREGDKK